MKTKKLFLIILTLVCFGLNVNAAPPCIISKYKDKVRLLGYNKVDQLTIDVDGVCTIRIECMDAGHIKCRPVSLDTYLNYTDNLGNPMRDVDEEIIDNNIAELIEIGEIRGKFIHNNMVLVVWQLDIESDNVRIDMYNREAASRSLGINF